MPEVLSQRELDAMHAYWRAAKDLSVGQIYLYDYPLLEKPLSQDITKHGDDMPEVTSWTWGQYGTIVEGRSSTEADKV